ncbi:RidA family protein [Pseudomonas aeruginosa]|uniref:RidA family protein n=1 Tax=Pseudomonas aeruginosa TaxID=287 RepID=UPI000EB75D57|nr:RidA family protein [Pseudomonas aeruginosa]AYF71004.1 RidA family protein [Pseudomonas aeruginosa]
MQTSPAPAIVAGGAYQPVVLHAGIAYVSGQLPRQHGELRWTGKVGSELDLEQARQAARLCAARCLLALEEALGGLQRVERLLKVTGYVASAAGFVQQPAVIDAASEYFDEVLGGARGGHARAAVGVAELPRGAAVEVELIAAVRP